MPGYVSGGQMVDNQSTWRLSYVPELFWGFVNFVVLFFQTLINPGGNGKGSEYTSDYRNPGRGPDPFGGGGFRRRMGRIGRGGAGPRAPPMAGGG